MIHDILTEQNEVLFDDLAEPLKYLLCGLKPGEFAIKLDTGNEQYAIRLDKITPVLNKATKNLNVTRQKNASPHFS